LLNKEANKTADLDSGFHYRHLGSFAYIGSEHAVAEFAGSCAKRRQLVRACVQHADGSNVSCTEGLVLEGFGAWWLWRSVYLSKQYSLRNKLYVGVNWLKTWIFGRDITRA
jgi:NADH:ubiquinone reductase (non-electrogenic)